MKKWMGVLLGIGVLLLGWSTFRSADASGDRCGLVEQRVSVVTRGGAGRAFVAVDDLGEIPFIDPATGETIIPLRPFFTILADQNAVQWDEVSRTAQFAYGGHQFSVEVALEGGVIATRLDGTPHPLRAYLCDGRLHAPLRSVTEALGLELQWYQKERTAVIDPVWTTGVQPSPVPAPVDVPKAQRPAACNTLQQVGLSDLLSRPLDAWGRMVRRTACSLII